MNSSRMLSVSDDFEHWTPPATFLTAQHELEGMYNNTGFDYGCQYLGFLTHFDKGADTQSQSLRLLSSRNAAESWDRVNLHGAALIPPGDVGSWDRFQIMLTGAAPIAVRDKLYIYYRGTPRRHNKAAKEFNADVDADQDKYPSEGEDRVISDCHFRKTGTEYDREPGIKRLSGTAKGRPDITQPDSHPPSLQKLQMTSEGWLRSRLTSAPMFVTYLVSFAKRRFSSITWGDTGFTL
jgi:hypothetical protein